MRNQEFELTLTKDSVVSTDERFSMDDLGVGDNFKSLDAYFQDSKGKVIKRRHKKGEHGISNQTMPRLVFQIFESDILALSEEEKLNFPVCKYGDKPMITGIFSSEEEFTKYTKLNARVSMSYKCNDGSHLIIYCWNIFSTIYFAQECLKRFGRDNDKFVLSYTEKDKKNEFVEENIDEALMEEATQDFKGYNNCYSQVLIESKNLIFRGAPGTGKTHLAREIAADIVSDGHCNKYELLSDEQKKQIEFVQFHPSYDYSDFVEGLRPKVNSDGTMGFELKDGIFKKFVSRARKNYEDSQKTIDVIEKENTAQELISSFFSDLNFDIDTFKTLKGNEFTINGVDENYIHLYVPKNEKTSQLKVDLNAIRQMLESGENFTQVKDVTSFFNKIYATQEFSYDLVLFNEIKKQQKKVPKTAVSLEKLKKYIFIIDEINRGDISKIFGELFFSIDPGYRGESGAVSTQYSNLHVDVNEKFYIPDNVYIIGTMNDIDRSVESFDFAMRRRFRFIELKANENLDMLNEIKDEGLRREAISRMTRLNDEIVKVEDLNENYQIGASYFLKLNSIGFDKIWTDYLRPLLEEYVQGMYDEKGIMERFREAFGYMESSGNEDDESSQS